MARIRHETHPNGLIVYTNPGTRRTISVWADDLRGIRDACVQCATERSSAVARLAQGQFSPSTLANALRELEAVRDRIDPDALDETERDDYIDLLTAIDDLRGVIQRIKLII